MIYHSHDKMLDPMQGHKMYQSEGKLEQQRLEDLNFDGLNLRDSDPEDGDSEDAYDELEQKHSEQEHSESEENELFKYLDTQEKMSERDKQAIFFKLNQEIPIEVPEKAAQQVEKQTQ